MVVSRKLPEEMKKTMKKSVRIVDESAEIPNSHVPTRMRSVTDQGSRQLAQSGCNGSYTGLLWRY
jgi:hypothetical protein